MLYLVCESISGGSKVIEADTPRRAVISYLKEDTEVNPNAGSWCYDFEITEAEEKG